MYNKYNVIAFFFKSLMLNSFFFLFIYFFFSKDMKKKRVEHVKLGDIISTLTSSVWNDSSSSAESSGVKKQKTKLYKLKCF